MNAQLPVVTYDDWHGDTAYDEGGFWTTRMFWDCECDMDYIHSKEQTWCEECGAHAEDQPDSRVSEVVNTGLAIDNPFMTLGEAMEIVWDLAKQNQFDPDDADGAEDLLAHARRQQLALGIVEDFIVNELGED